LRILRKNYETPGNFLLTTGGLEFGEHPWDPLSEVFVRMPKPKSANTLNREQPSNRSLSTVLGMHVPSVLINYPAHTSGHAQLNQEYEKIRVASAYNLD
jgi:hypothetical protein